MAAPRRRPTYIRVVTIAVSLAVAAPLAAPEPAQAQGLFDLLLGIFRGTAPRAYSPEPAPRRALPQRLLKSSPVEEDSIQKPRGGPYIAYCVRTCDGRYFPLPANSRGQNATPANLCSAMCPSAQTRIYSGGSIDDAVANDGKRYSELKNAFVYRDKLVTDCTCNGHDTNGTARIDPMEDPTLRRGDIIVTADGPLVLKGSRGTRRTARDFVPAEDDRNLPKSVRATLGEMRIAPEAPAATVKSEPVEVNRPALSTTPGVDSTAQGAQMPRPN